MIYIILGISLVAFVLGLICLVFLVNQRSRITDLQTQNDRLTQELQTAKAFNQGLREEILEIREGTLGMGQTVKDLSQHQQKLAQQHQAIQEQEPGSRLYQQAAKLVAQGASVEELMQECELPRAEAELLFNLHTK